MLIIGTYICEIISRSNDSNSTRNGSPLDFLFVLYTVSEETNVVKQYYKKLIVLSKIKQKNEVFAEY